MNDEQLREWYQARRTRPDAGDHPSPEAMVALIRREGSETERLACLDHVIGCETCRPEFELLRSIGGADPAPHRRALPGWLPLAAAVALAAGAGSLWLLLRAPDQTLRSGGASTVTLVTPVGGAAERPLRSLASSAVLLRQTGRLAIRPAHSFDLRARLDENSLLMLCM